MTAPEDPRSEKASDAELVRACRRGDPRAWALLIGRYRRLIYSISVAYRLESDRRDDVFQDVAVRLLEHIERIRNAESLASWISVTTRRECQAVLRGVRRFETDDDALDAIPEPSRDVAEVLDAIDAEHAVAVAFDRLGEPCRSLLAALYVEEPTPEYAEIARRLGRPIGSLGPTRSRCLGKLKTLYEESGARKR